MRHFKIIAISALAILMVSSCSKNESIESQEAIKYENVLKAAATPPTDDPFPDICGVETYSLLGGQTMHMGTVQVVYDGDDLWVKYEALPGYLITETHLHVGSIGDMPDTKNGSPKIGHFDFANENTNGDDEVVYKIPFDMEIGDCIDIVPHAVIRSEDGSIEETCWPNSESLVFAMKTLYSFESTVYNWAITGIEGIDWCENFRYYPLDFNGTKTFDLIRHNGDPKIGSVEVIRDGTNAEFLVTPDPGMGVLIRTHLFVGTAEEFDNRMAQGCESYKSFPYPEDPWHPENPIHVELSSGDTGVTLDLPGPGWGWYIRFCLEDCP